MDPVSQGVTGALFSQTFSDRYRLKYAGLIGALSAMSADLDILIRSSTDPLLVMEYHRHFTHSLLFIPVGSLICSLILWPFFRKSLGFKRIFIYSLAGYSTAGLLDACTSYGTSLYWPFSDKRITWNLISVIDPVFTIGIAGFLVMSLRRGSRKIAVAGLIFALIYLMMGYYQKLRVEHALSTLANKRGHSIERMFVHPTLGNIILWRTIYRSGESYYVDAVRAGIFKRTKIYEGSETGVFDIEKYNYSPDINGTLYKDIKRFDHFSLGYLTAFPETGNIIGDLRYSMIPNGITPLWAIDISSAGNGHHVRILRPGKYDKHKFEKFMLMLMGEPFDK